jgi:hypothetical protein
VTKTEPVSEERATEAPVERKGPTKAERATEERATEERAIGTATWHLR